MTTLFKEVLDRAPDSVGETAWLEGLAIGTPPEEVAREFFASADRKSLQRQRLAPRIGLATALADALKA